MYLQEFENKKHSYIYIREHESYIQYNIVKIGRTKLIPERNMLYKTSEYYSGKFVRIYEVKFNEDIKIEYNLKKYFKYLHRIKNGGTEFYDKQIINEIEDFFSKFNYSFRLLSEEEINKKLLDYLIRENQKYIKKINDLILSYILKKRQIKKSVIIIKRFILKYIKTFKKNKDINNLIINEIPSPDLLTSIQPFPYQTEIINNSIEYFQTNDKGILVLSCGVGKTFTSLWVTKGLLSKKILIGVPNLLLIKQWYNDVLTIFPNYDKSKILIISGEINNQSIEYFLKKNLNDCIILTTYASAFKIYQITEKLQYSFDMKILDECHHLTCIDYSSIDKENSRQFIMTLEISSTKQLALTATLKEIECELVNCKTISNTNIDFFGEIIERRCLYWAIHEKVVCDYIINVIETKESEITEDINTLSIQKDEDKKLLLAAYAGLQSLLTNNTHHILIYCNKIDNTIKIKKYIKYLLKNKIFESLKENMYYDNYHSEQNSFELKTSLNNFLSSPKGILSCVYGLGEGWDCKKLDGVVFAENMSSSIRIVQSALRSGRKNKDEPNKINKLILPILDLKNLIDKENPDFQKLRQIIWQMAWEDENIIEKIFISNFDETNKNKGGSVNHPSDKEENNTSIILTGLKQIERPPGISYNRAKFILAKNNIKSIQLYNDFCMKDNRFYKNPEEQYGTEFKGWVDYLSIEYKYYDKYDCVQKINEYLNLYQDLNNYTLNLSFICEELCKLDNNFPPFGTWIEYYDLNSLSDLIKIEIKLKKVKLF